MLALPSQGQQCSAEGLSEHCKLQENAHAQVSLVQHILWDCGCAAESRSLGRECDVIACDLVLKCDPVLSIGW